MNNIFLASIPFLLISCAHPPYEQNVVFQIEPNTTRETSAMKKIVSNSPILDKAIVLGMRNISLLLDKEHNYRPYFVGNIFTKATNVKYGDNNSGGDTTWLRSIRVYDSNVIGRGLYAFYVGSDVTGEHIDPKMFARFVAAQLESVHKPIDGNYSNKDPKNRRFVGLSGDPESDQSYEPSVHYIFNQGPATRGLVALAMVNPNARFEGYSFTAREMVLEAIRNTQKYYVNGKTETKSKFNWEAFRREFGLRGGNSFDKELADQLFADWTNISPDWEDAYTVYALLKYYDATKDKEALKLSIALKENVFKKRFPLKAKDIPRYVYKHPAYPYGHIYEPIAEMAAYAHLAEIQKSEEDMKRIRVRYDAMLAAGYVTETGWAAENFDKKSDVGEINSTGELAEMFLSFAKIGWTNYYENAERFTRASLLPMQTIDPSIIDGDGDGKSDRTTNIKTRLLGAYSFAAPYGIVSTKNPYYTGVHATDCVAGAITSLSEIKRNVVTDRGGVPSVNMLFDYKSDALEVMSPYTAKDRIHLKLTKGGSVWMRFPSWGDKTAFGAEAKANKLTVMWKDNFAKLSGLTAKKNYSLALPLVERASQFALNGRTIRFTWLGDSIGKMDSMGTPIPFFPDFSENKTTLR